MVKENQDKQNELIKEVKLLTSLDPELPSQTIEEAIKFVISKTQENCQLARIFRTTFDEKQGEVVASYLHNKLSPNVGRIGAVFVSINFACRIECVIIGTQIIKRLAQ
jgi:translation elongation factor EF-Ts